MMRVSSRSRPMWIVALALMVVGLIGAAGCAEAQGVIERLLMPGELIQGHAKYEADCANCHKSFSRAAQKQLCLDCHKDVAKDVADKTRFHGKSPAVANTECRQCHTEHKGRTADIVQLDRTTFDHKLTNFALGGSHKTVVCQSCHAGERYQGIAATCSSCHGERDVHKGARGQKCEGCHTTETWAAGKFDHDADTKFALRGKHSTATCESCHKQPAREVKPSMACGSCHQKDDAHKGQLGTACQKCHNESGFKVGVLFDHDATKFPLVGKHVRAACSDCHKSKAYKDAPTACVGCHRKQDDRSHEGRLGATCGQCHTPVQWSGARFDHSKTKFALTGRHAQTGCYNCHKQKHVERASLSGDCYACHKTQDRHRGAFGRNCANCHTTSTFAVAFIRR